MRNGKPVTRTCLLKIECVDCGERYFCYSDKEIEILEKEKEQALVRKNMVNLGKRRDEPS